MTKKTLKICDKPLVTSECWTYYKLAIIQTLPRSDLWLVNHLKLYCDENGDSMFGEDCTMYPLSYYGDILNIEDGCILNIAKNKIIEFIIDNINKDRYILLDLNFKRFFDPDENSFRLHETLIYGYDCLKQEFITSILSNNSFKEIRLGFEEIEESYNDVLNYYKADKNRLFDRKLWFLGITILSGKNYSNENSEFDLVCRLKWELDGNIYVKQNTNINRFYTGISCTEHLSEKLSELLFKKNFNVSLMGLYGRTCLKISERQKILLHAITVVISKYNTNGCKDIIREYNNCCKMMDTNVLLFYKYEYTCDEKVVTRIIDSLNQIMPLEKDIFERVIQIIRNNFLVANSKNFYN